MKDSITVRNTTEYKKWQEPVEIRASSNLADTVRELKEQWAKELCFNDCMCIAYALYDAGFQPSWSSGYCDEVIAGFGDDPHGFKYELLIVKGNGCWDIVPWAEVKEMIAHKERD